MSKGTLLALTVALSVLFQGQVAMAVDAVVYGEAVIGPQKDAREIRVLGPDLFGEEINASTGGIAFSQADLTLPGNDSLPVAVVRRLIIDGNKSPSRPSDASLWRGYMFGEWEFDLPYLSGMYSEDEGWVVNTSSPNARCSSPTAFEQYRPNLLLRSGYVYFYSHSYWNGLQLNVPGIGEKQVLYRASGGGLPSPTGSWTALTTNDQWHFSCLASLQSGQAGEGFLALAPDGTRYWFNWMVSHEDRPLRGSGYIIDCCGIKPMKVTAELNRRVYRLYPTRIEDRFGNYVTYAWTGNRMTAIAASDGRSLAFTYNGSGQITTASDGTRTIHYGYSDGLLISVTLPDATQWTYSSTAVVNLPRFVPVSDEDPFDHPYPCQLMRRLVGTEANLVMTHPSGAQGTFQLGYNRLHRTNLNGSTGTCNAVVGPEGASITWVDHQPVAPTRFDVLALRNKTVSGAGIASQTWQYQHQESFGLKVPEGYPINGTRTVTTTRPDGSMSVETYGTDALVNEGQLLSKEIREGTVVLSREDNTYVQTSEIASMPFPDWMGEPLAYEYVRGRSDYNRPLKQSMLTQQGRRFTRTIEEFDVLARPVQVNRSNSPVP